MTPTDRILERIEKELHTSDFVIILLSQWSVASDWVKTELKYAILRQEKEERTFLIPVLLEDCELPTDVADRPYHDWRREQTRPAVVQAIVNMIQGTKPFSYRVRDFLSKHDSRSPYKRNQDHGRRLQLAKYPEMEIANNQWWLLWELFHRLLARYPCTMKVGPLAADGIAFMIVDRWNETICGVKLTREEFERGLWSGELNLLENAEGSSWRGSGVIDGPKLKFLGRQGLLSWDRSYNPNVRANRAEPSAHQPMSRVLEDLRRVWTQIEESARQSFLYDYQRMVFPADWPKVKVVVGSAPCDISLAFSPILKSADPDQPDLGAVFEFYHPFFQSLKVTQIYTKQLDHQWEGDADLFSPETETLLGLA
jgi:hypothetical protein